MARTKKEIREKIYKMQKLRSYESGFTTHYKTTVNLSNDVVDKLNLKKGTKFKQRVENGNIIIHPIKPEKKSS